MAELGELARLVLDNEIYMKIVQCVLLVIVGIFIHLFSKAWITKRLSKRATGELLQSKKLNTLITFLLSTVRYVVYFFIFYLFCKVLNLPIDSMFIAIAGASSVAFGLGAQTLIKNIINGFFILLEDQYSVGDVVEIGDYKGTVDEIGLRTTKIKDLDGNRYIIPNGEINTVTNMTHSKYPSYIEVNLPYEAGAKVVLDLLDEEMSELYGNIDGLLSPPRVLGISSFGQYCYTIKIMVESEQRRYLAVERQIRYAIKKRFDSEYIPMPYIKPFAPEK